MSQLNLDKEFVAEMTNREDALTIEIATAHLNQFHCREQLLELAIEDSGPIKDTYNTKLVIPLEYLEDLMTSGKLTTGSMEVVHSQEVTVLNIITAQIADRWFNENRPERQDAEAAIANMTQEQKDNFGAGLFVGRWNPMDFLVQRLIANS